MDKKRKSQISFLDRLCNAAEHYIGMSQHDRGFKRALSKALDARDSTIQRWFGGSYPDAEYLVKIHQKFGITPNQLFGIEDAPSKVESLDLRKVKFIAGARDKNLPECYLDPKQYNVGPILRDSRSACHPDRIDEADIDSWGITRKDLVLHRENVYGVIVPERIGMSMWPIIKPGDLMVIDASDKSLIDGGIFALNIKNGEFTVRQIKKVADSLILIPWFLRQYQVEMINLNEYPNVVIGRIIFSVTYLMALGSEPPPAPENIAASILSSGK
jgi:phage repressor protein C with HTH and peptisase S24 domain